MGARQDAARSTHRTAMSPASTDAAPTQRARHFNAAETAKLIRLVLRADFPGVTFSVRSSRYAGGSSVDISYTDGPTRAEVEAAVSGFDGKRFDGMIDFAWSVDSYLLAPDAKGVRRATLAHDPGSERTGGSRPEVRHQAPEGAELAHFYPSVMVRRSYSADALRGAVAFVWGYFAHAWQSDPAPTVSDGPYAHVIGDRYLSGACDHLSTLAHRELSPTPLTGVDGPDAVRAAIQRRRDDERAAEDARMAAWEAEQRDRE